MTCRTTFKGRDLFERHQNVNTVVSDKEALCFKTFKTTLDSPLPGDKETNNSEAPSGVKAKNKKKKRIKLPRERWG